MLIRAHAQGASTRGGVQLETDVPRQLLQSAQSLVHTLAESAQAHNAKLQMQAAVEGATAKAEMQAHAVREVRVRQMSTGL